MSDKTMRRQSFCEATGPTAAEFAAEGVTFLVGSLDYRFGLPDTPWNEQLHLAAGRAGRVDTIPQLVGGMPVVGRLAFRHGLPETPWDEQLNVATNHGASRVDALPQLVGDLATLLSGKEATPDALAKKHYLRQVRAQNKVQRQANRTGAATQQLLGWFERNEGDVVADWTTGEGLWTEKSKGAGFVFNGDEFTVRAVQNKARAIAKDPRFHSYVAVVPTTEPEQYLVAFVIDPKLVPVTYEDALNIAESTMDDPSSLSVSTDADEIQVSPMADNASGLSVGSIFNKLFPPKKPEAIQKRIDKLTAEIEELKSSLAEAQSKGLYNGPAVGLMPYTNAWKWSPLALYAQMGSNPATESALGPILLDKLDTIGDHDDGYDDSEDGEGDEDLTGDPEGEYGELPEAGRMSTSAHTTGRSRKKKRHHKKHHKKHHKQQQQQSQPQVVVIRDSSSSDDDGYDDEDEYEDDYDEGLTAVGILPDWDPGSGMVDVPYWNPTGATANYPVGGLTAVGRIR